MKCIILLPSCINITCALVSFILCIKNNLYLGCGCAGRYIVLGEVSETFCPINFPIIQFIILVTSEGNSLLFTDSCLLFCNGGTLGNQILEGRVTKSGRGRFATRDKTSNTKS